MRKLQPAGSCSHTMPVSDTLTYLGAGVEHAVDGRQADRQSRRTQSLAARYGSGRRAGGQQKKAGGGKKEVHRLVWRQMLCAVGGRMLCQALCYGRMGGQGRMGSSCLCFFTLAGRGWLRAEEFVCLSSSAWASCGGLRYVGGLAVVASAHWIMMVGTCVNWQ